MALFTCLGIVLPFTSLQILRLEGTCWGSKLNNFVVFSHHWWSERRTLSSACSCPFLRFFFSRKLNLCGSVVERWSTGFKSHTGKNCSLLHSASWIYLERLHEVPQKVTSWYPRCCMDCTRWGESSFCSTTLPITKSVVCARTHTGRHGSSPYRKGSYPITQLLSQATVSKTH